MDPTGGVGRIAQYQQLDVVVLPQHLPERVGSDEVSIVLLGFQYDRRRPRQADHLGIRRPVRCRNDDAVHRSARGQDALIHALLGPVPDDNLRLGVVLQILSSLQILGNRLAQIGRAGDGRVARIAIGNGPGGRIEDGLGWGEIGLADAEGRHVDALGLHLLDEGEDFDRLANLDRGHDGIENNLGLFCGGLEGRCRGRGRCGWAWRC
mmetsp:Transcript_16383/g.47056  ORF Transcript_16383/g.47056 Transcript_16383/m.47056 type:complete len:208 (-) Transcript_16383:170-793(-)